MNKRERQPILPTTKNSFQGKFHVANNGQTIVLYLCRRFKNICKEIRDTNESNVWAMETKSIQIKLDYRT